MSALGVPSSETPAVPWASMRVSPTTTAAWTARRRRRRVPGGEALSARPPSAPPAGARPRSRDPRAPAGCRAAVPRFGADERQGDVDVFRAHPRPGGRGTPPPWPSARPPARPRRQRDVERGPRATESRFSVWKSWRWRRPASRSGPRHAIRPAVTVTGAAKARTHQLRIVETPMAAKRRRSPLRAVGRAKVGASQVISRRKGHPVTLRCGQVTATPRAERSASARSISVSTRPFSQNQHPTSRPPPPRRPWSARSSVPACPVSSRGRRSFARIATTSRPCGPATGSATRWMRRKEGRWTRRSGCSATAR